MVIYSSEASFLTACQAVPLLKTAFASAFDPSVSVHSTLVRHFMDTLYVQWTSVYLLERAMIYSTW